MRKLLALTCLLMLAAGCPADGANVGPGDNDWTPVDPDAGGDAPAAEDAQKKDSGPPFDSQLGWKVVDIGESETWYDLMGAEAGGDYEVFLSGGLGAVAWYHSAKDEWNHINLAQSVEVTGVWATSHEYVVICGEGGLLKRYYDWKKNGVLDWYDDDLSTGINADLEDVWGTGPDDLWVVGTEGAILHWDGTDWNQHTPSELGIGTPAPDLAAVYTPEPGTAYIGGDEIFITYKDGVFTVDFDVVGAYRIRSIYGAAGKVWVGAEKGTVLELQPDGTFSPLSPITNPGTMVNALWYSPGGTLYAGGGQPFAMLWQYDAGTDSWDYLQVKSPSFIKQDGEPFNRVSAQARISGIWGTDDENIFVVTKEKQVVHYAVHP